MLNAKAKEKSQYRQFITREKMNYGILECFEEVLRNYCKTNLPSEMGLPTVNYCASELFLYPNYFGDLVKKETSTTAHAYIQNAVINLAKSKVSMPNKSLGEIAYELGYKKPITFFKTFQTKNRQNPLGVSNRELIFYQTDIKIDGYLSNKMILEYKHSFLSS